MEALGIEFQSGAAGRRPLYDKTMVLWWLLLVFRQTADLRNITCGDFISYWTITSRHHDIGEDLS